MSTVQEKVLSARQNPPATPAWGYVIGVGAFVTIAIFIAPWAEAFTLPKVLALMGTALACLPLLWARRSTLLANRWLLALAGGFLLVALASQALSGAPQAISLWGEWFRRSGTLTTIALVLVFAAASVLTRSEVRVVLAWTVAAGVPATLYGLIQLVGKDPFPWTDQGWIVSTFGNPNFAAAGLAILAVLTAGLALTTTFSTLWRVLMAPLAALEALLALQTGSSQALFALAVGTAAGAVAWLLRWDNASRVKALMGLAIAAALTFVLTLMALFGIGPLVSLTSTETLLFRKWYWEAALGMAGGHPLLGVGPDGYGRFYGEYRPMSSLEMPTLGASAAHNVPLQWASTIGIPAALLYVVLMLCVVVVVLRRLWLKGPAGSALAMPLLAAFAAYQIQSLVSIDATPIALLGWLSAGLLLAVTGPQGSDARTGAGGWVSAGILALAGLVVWLPAVLASNASQTVVQGNTEQDVYDAIALVEGTVLPCEPSVRVAQWMIQVAPAEQTVNGVYTGATTNDRCYGLIDASASLALQLEQATTAVDFAERGTAIDPLNYSRWIMLARAQHLAGDNQGAVNSLARAAKLSPAAQQEIDQIAVDLGLPPAS